METGPAPQRKFVAGTAAEGKGLEVNFAEVVVNCPQAAPFGRVPPTNLTRYKSPSCNSGLATVSVVLPLVREMVKSPPAVRVAQVEPLLAERSQVLDTNPKASELKDTGAVDPQGVATAEGFSAMVGAQGYTGAVDGVFLSRS